MTRAFARFSPGVVLIFAVTEELVADATIVRANSCATADHPMIDRIWRERLALCDLLIAVRPHAPFAGRPRLGLLRKPRSPPQSRRSGYPDCGHRYFASLTFSIFCRRDGSAAAEGHQR